MQFTYFNYYIYLIQWRQNNKILFEIFYATSNKYANSCLDTLAENIIWYTYVLGKKNFQFCFSCLKWWLQLWLKLCCFNKAIINVISASFSLRNVRHCLVKQVVLNNYMSISASKNNVLRCIVPVFFSKLIELVRISGKL